MMDTDMEATFRRAVAGDLDLLAALHDRELDGETLAALKQAGFPTCLALNFKGAGTLAVQGALSDIVAGLDARDLDEMAAAYAEVYLTHGLGASPTESPWVDEDGLERQDAMLDLRGWYGRHGLRVADWARRSEDHLVHQLLFVAHLLRQEDGDQGLEEAARFLETHPLVWVQRFGTRIEQRLGPPFYAALAALTAAYLAQLREILRGLVPEAAAAAPAPCRQGCSA
jgi:TorA maturation chaperone TorD